MGIGDYVDKAKRALAGNEDKVAGVLDKAAEAVKSRTSSGTDARIDQAVGKARDFLEKQKPHDDAGRAADTHPAGGTRPAEPPHPAEPAPAAEPLHPTGTPRPAPGHPPVDPTAH